MKTTALYNTHLMKNANAKQKKQAKCPPPPKKLIQDLNATPMSVTELQDFIVVLIVHYCLIKYQYKICSLSSATKMLVFTVIMHQVIFHQKATRYLKKMHLLKMKLDLGEKSCFRKHMNILVTEKSAQKYKPASIH